MAHGHGPFDHWIATFLRKLRDRWIMPFLRCVFLGSFVALAHDKGPHDNSDLAEGDLACSVSRPFGTVEATAKGRATTWGAYCS